MSGEGLANAVDMVEEDWNWNYAISINLKRGERRLERGRWRWEQALGEPSDTVG